jgi:predicted alpha/beta superfamily hydrolase
MIKLPFTKIIDLKSKYNDFEYSLFIRFPSEYKDNKKSYPTLFLLDPEYLFSTCYAISSIYENYIIIGIGHKDLDFKELDSKTRTSKNDINRTRDFLPWKLDKNIFRKDVHISTIEEIVNVSGYADKFAEFINKQVIELVDDNFRTTKDRTLVGHSFGGVFASFMLLKYPDNFTKYIIITPVLAKEYYTTKEMFDLIIREKLLTKKIVYFSIGGEEGDDDLVNDYVETLKNNCSKIANYPNLLSKIEVIKDENHVSVVVPSIWRGLKFFDSIQKQQ